ncbi:MAG: hypothetical protein ACE37F_23495 [Nannocystaceae bacterium]|nr:hypothetical protein [bacterium]
MLRATQLLLTTSVLSLALLGGCDSEKKAEDSKEDAAEEKKPAKKPMAELFPGKSPELPPPLASVKLGGSEEEAEKAVPGLTSKLVALDEYEGDIKAGSFATDRGPAKVLVSMRLSVPTKGDELKAMLTEKWGEPKKQTELGKDVFAWYNAEKGLRVYLKESFSPDTKDVEYSAYMPFEKLIGTDKAKFGFETEPLLGMDLAGLNEHYGDVLEKLTKEEAKKKREQMKKMFGDKVDMLGEAQASTDIHLLPTELESYTTTVWPTFDKETGKIKSVRFTVPFEGQEGYDKELIATMKKVWGEPKEEEKYGKKRWVFSEEPFIVVEDSIGRAWEIEKMAKRD